VERVQKASAGTQRWVVLTSFSLTQADEPAVTVRPAMMVTMDGQHAIAAVPTGDGWLVIQL